MTIVTMLEASLRFGDEALLDKADFAIDEGQKICLVGRNGTGKSSLLKVLDGSLELDSGRLVLKQDLKAVRLDQDPPLNKQGTVYAMAASALGEVGQALAAYFGDDDGDKADLAAFIEQHDGWTLDARIRRQLGRLSLDPELKVETLSGGLKRKAALAAALVQEPELLLLDEPTNHLDVASIISLEEFIQNFNGTVLFVSHDRTFADHCADVIVELDRGKLYSYPGSFDHYLKMRDERLRMETLERKEFDRILSEEEAWIRRGVKARLARNEGRVRNLEQMREQRRNRRDRAGRAILHISEADRSGNIVYELTGVSLKLGDKVIADNFSATVMRQDRIGIVGPNGCGKTSLVRLLLEELKPDHGRVRQGVNLMVQYFDQYHEKLDPDKSVADNVAEGRRDLIINGKSVHVNSYLKDFLFTARRARSPVKVLSGGEKNRLMLARLFCRPCNVLILDEPTNDLDLETLELLEELVANFKGTVILISHDRRFIDRCATETWVFEGEGKIEDIVGGWSEVEAYYKRIGLWENPSEALSKKEQKEQVRLSHKLRKEELVRANAKRKGLSFKEQKELKELPSVIAGLEEELASLDEMIADPALYKEQGEKVKEILGRREALSQQIAQSYERWEALETKDEEAKIAKTQSD